MARILELAPQPARPELQAGDTLVQVLARPLRQSGIDRSIERDDPLRHTPRRRDHDRHHGARIEEEHLDMTHGRRLERRRRDERQLTRDLREHLRGRLENGVDLAPEVGEIEREQARPRVLARQQLRRIELVALFRRDPARGGVRVRQQPTALELSQLVPHGRGGYAQPAELDEVPGAHRLPARHILLDHEREQAALALRESCRKIRRHLQEL